MKNLITLLLQILINFWANSLELTLPITIYENLSKIEECYMTECYYELNKELRKLSSDIIDRVAILLNLLTVN